jgi:hypothetical protein
VKGGVHCDQRAVHFDPVQKRARVLPRPHRRVFFVRLCAAFEAIAATLPGSVLFEREPDDKGERQIWARTSPAHRGTRRSSRHFATLKNALDTRAAITHLSIAPADGLARFCKLFLVP